MKFTSEDLMKAMGLQIGDRIRWIYTSILGCYRSEMICKVEKTSCGIELVNIEDNCSTSLEDIIGIDYEILPRPKRVGELGCEEIGCENCPLRMLCGITDTARFICNLYGAFKEFTEKYTPSTHFDQEIYDLLKARLDKEVE